MLQLAGKKISSIFNEQFLEKLRIRPDELKTVVQEEMNRREAEKRLQFQQVC